ncbi:hypothetical protein [Sphingosinicella sp.]|uniref:hypothetical protein n=1 Tax=Sphingosinicella sp. TaxID=1917971 RepID=UPI004037FC0B
MTTGVERAEAHAPDHRSWNAANETAIEPVESFSFHDLIEEEEQSRRIWPTILAFMLIAAALGWLGFSGYALWTAWPGSAPAAWLAPLATISAPLILLALTWLLFGRSSRRETERFAEAVRALRSESETLEQALAVIASRLHDNRAALSDEASRLMSLGDEAADRIGRTTRALAGESAALDRTAQALDTAAASARIDIGVLLSDLPQAEAQARAAAESIRASGLSAHEQSASLEGHLAALAARGREADEALGGAAQRLGAQVTRLETSAGAAVERIDQSAAAMNLAVDGAMGRAADAVEQARAGLDAQGQTVLAMVEQSRAAFEGATADAGQALIVRLGEASAAVEALAGHLARQDRAGARLAERLAAQLGEIEGQIAALGASGEAQSGRIGQALASLREVAQALRGELGEGEAAGATLIGRTQDLGSALSVVATQLRDELPAALATVEQQAERTSAAALGLVPAVEGAQASAALAAEALGESEASLNRQRAGLEMLLAATRDGVAEAEAKLATLAAALDETDTASARLVQETGPALVESLVRVREAAQQAANHAREAIVAAIPDSVAALADATREALAEATAEPVQDQLAEVAGASQRAMAVARQASERLTRQLLTMSETAAAIEDRIAEDRAAREEQDAEALSRRVSLLIEALNSTAIDVNKLLSNEVADTAWAAYLRGDRGVFTRRAVRLLDTGEAREIQRHYEEEPDFRDQVNRYVHDFEAMLRRVLADRDGHALAVTLLSSDMGKLYVALAQAIERLRR